MPKLLPNFENDVSAIEGFAAVNLIALDLDGTLIPAELSHKIQHLTRSLRRSKVTVTLATGRTLTGVHELSKKLGLSARTPLILYNGSVVIETRTHRIIHQKHISWPDFDVIVAAALARALPVLAYFFCDPVRDLAEVRGSLESVRGWSTDPTLPERMRQDFNGMPINWSSPVIEHRPVAPSAILIPILPDASSSALESAASVIAESADVNITQSGDSFLVVGPQESNKGVALAALCQFLGVHQHEAIAVGDNDNDIEMLAYAGIGVAVASASEGAIAASSYVCRHGTFKGVVEVLRLVKEAKRYFSRTRQQRRVP